MPDHIIIQRLILSDHHRSTDKTRHFVYGNLISSPTEIQIVKYPDDPGYYLFYLDAEGQEMTDTYHDSLDKAMIQASWEFQVKADEWEILDHSKIK